MLRNEPEPGHGKAVVRGGCGCLVLMFAFLFLGVVTGGYARADFLGIVGVFVIGAVLGVGGNELFKRGYRRGYQAAEDDDAQRLDSRMRRAEAQNPDEEE